MPERVAPEGWGWNEGRGVSLRGAVLLLVFMALLGLAAELVLLEHVESTSQWIPLVVLGVSFVAGAAAALRPGRGTIRFFQLAMAACVVSGAVGVYLHLDGNLQFEREMDAGMSGLALFWEALRGATPTLAPGALAHLGLLGLAATWRHPALRPDAPASTGTTTSRTSRQGHEMNRTILPALLCALLATAACGGDSQAERTDAATPDGAAPAAAPAETGPAANTPAAPTDSAAAAAGVPAVTEGVFLDPNTATREQLLTVSHMTPQLADALVAGRPYADMVAVDKVLTGLNEQQRDEVYTRLWKPLDLNKASKEEIELIPRVGARMRHEFEEYRPYRGMEQFRREIGKYVDEAEVARLERYVTIGS